MDELYSYLNRKIGEMYMQGASEVTIDVAHLCQMLHLVCHMKQIRSIVRMDEELQEELERALIEKRRNRDLLDEIRWPNGHQSENGADH